VGARGERVGVFGKGKRGSALMIGKSASTWKEVFDGLRKGKRRGFSAGLWRGNCRDSRVRGGGEEGESSKEGWLRDA